MTRVRAAPLFALGVSLARRGIVPVVSLVVCAGTVLVLAILAFVLAARGPEAPVHDVPLIASSWLAWGGGFLLAFAAAAHALRRDRAEGVRDLVAMRTTTMTGYIVARVGGLAALLAAIVAGGTLLCGVLSSLAAMRVAAVPRTLHATAAGVAFGIAFAAVVAPVAFAALGARSRMGGYLFLVGVVVVPELFASLLSSVLPEELIEVLSIPSALAALRSGLAPGSVDLLRAIRATVALGLFGGIAVVLVRRDAALLERSEAEA
jgi:hypothetical protein